MIYLVSNQQELFPSIPRIGVEELLLKFEDTLFLGCDTETTGLDCHSDEVFLLQLGNGINQYVIDLQTVDIKKFKTLLENTILVIHNAKFDLKFFYKHGIYPKNVFDTFLAESIIHTGKKTVRKSLKACVQRYFNVDIDKSQRARLSPNLTIASIEYSAKDVEFLIRLRNKQIAILKENNLMSAMTIDNEFVKVLAYTEFCGFHLDTDKWKEKMKNDKIRLEKALKTLEQYVMDNNHESFLEKSTQLDMFKTVEAGTTINWASPAQVIKYFKYLGIDTWDGEHDTVDSKHLATQKHEIIPLYLEYKAAQKVVSTYGQNYLDSISPVTGRLHTEFKQIMNTGRLSCGGKQGKKQLLNFQNIPSDSATRSCFTAPKNKALIVADYSGQEQIVLANKSKEPNILSFYEKKLGDMHSFVASKIYPELADLPLSEIKEKHKEKRQTAKAAGFAINYGGNGATIAGNLGVSLELGNAVYDAYFKAFPKLKDYFSKCEESALKNGYILFNSVSGRKSYIDFFSRFQEMGEKLNSRFWNRYREEREKDSAEFKKMKLQVSKYYKWKSMISKRSLNYPIQGTSADITKEACSLFFSKLRKLNLLGLVKIVNIVHDEIVIECPLDVEELMAHILKECMEKAGERYCKTVKLTAEPVITNHWTH